jgi:hypothetical protein
VLLHQISRRLPQYPRDLIHRQLRKRPIPGHHRLPDRREVSLGIIRPEQRAKDDVLKLRAVGYLTIQPILLAAISLLFGGQG